MPKILRKEPGSIEIVWTTDDIQRVREDLTDEQCIEVLSEVVYRYNAEIGVTWQAIEVYADEMFPRHNLRSDRNDEFAMD